MVCYVARIEMSGGARPGVRGACWVGQLSLTQEEFLVMANHIWTEEEHDTLKTFALAIDSKLAAINYEKLRELLEVSCPSTEGVTVEAIRTGEPAA